MLRRFIRLIVLILIHFWRRGEEVRGSPVGVHPRLDHILAFNVFPSQLYSRVGHNPSVHADGGVSRMISRKYDGTIRCYTPRCLMMTLLGTE